MCIRTGAAFGILLAKWKHIATVATPLRSHIGYRLESMRNPVLNLFFIRTPFIIGLRDTLCHHFLVTLPVASVLAIGTLHSRRVLEQFTAERTAHDVVELLFDKLVPIHLVNLIFPGTNGALSSKAEI